MENFRIQKEIAKERRIAYRKIGDGFSIYPKNSEILNNHREIDKF